MNPCRPSDGGRDLIDTLLADQHQVGLEVESALQRFANGLDAMGKVTPGGVQSVAAVG